METRAAAALAPSSKGTARRERDDAARSEEVRTNDQVGTLLLAPRKRDPRGVFQAIQLSILERRPTRWALHVLFQRLRSVVPQVNNTSGVAKKRIAVSASRQYVC